MLDKLPSLSAWIPALSICLTASLFNFITSYSVLLEGSRRLVFFRPYRSLGFWIWSVVQLFFPFLGFWLMFSVNEKIQVNLGEFVKAAFFGIGFFAFVNSAPQIGQLTVDFKRIYGLLLKIPVDMIMEGQLDDSTDFWHDLGVELQEKIAQDIAIIDRGLERLTEYVSISTETFRQSLLPVESTSSPVQVSNLIERARSETEVGNKADLIKTALIMFVRRKHLHSFLEEMGCVESAKRLKSGR